MIILTFIVSIIVQSYKKSVSENAFSSITNWFTEFK